MDIAILQYILYCAFAILICTYIIGKLFYRNSSTDTVQTQNNDEGIINWETSSQRYKKYLRELRDYKKRAKGVSEDVLVEIRRLEDKESAMKDIIKQFNFKEKEQYEILLSEGEYLKNTDFPKTHFHQHSKKSRLKAIFGVDEDEAMSPIEKAKQKMYRKAESIYDSQLEAARKLVESKKPLSEQEIQDAKYKADFIRHYRGEYVDVVGIQTDREKFDELKKEKVEAMHQQNQVSSVENRENILTFVLLLFFLYIYIDSCN